MEKKSGTIFAWVCEGNPDFFLLTESQEQVKKNEFLKNFLQEPLEEFLKYLCRIYKEKFRQTSERFYRRTFEEIHH